MRVLIVHNAYQTSSPSGEDAVARDEAALLRGCGHQVREYWRYNDELAGRNIVSVGLTAGLGSLWSVSSARALQREVEIFKPDVVHFHNIFPLISPSGPHRCHALGIPSVMTLHNFRMFCANGLLFREGEPCELCPDSGRHWALVHRCYRGSRIMSAAPVIGQVVHRGLKTLERSVDRFVVLSEFARDKLAGFGLPRHKMVVRPNFAPTPAKVDLENTGEIAFVGRLDYEKGVEVLLDAASRAPQTKFVVMGDGPLRQMVESCGLENLHFAGRLDSTQVVQRLSGCAALVVPSLCYEGFPRSIAEAMSLGVPVIASRLGALETIVQHGETGYLFEPGDGGALASACEEIGKNPKEAQKMRGNCLAEYSRRLSPRAAEDSLTDIYLSVVGEGR